MGSKIFQILIIGLFIFLWCFLSFSLAFIIFSFLINGGEISFDEVKEIVVFYFKVFSLGTPLILLSIFISNKIRK